MRMIGSNIKLFLIATMILTAVFASQVSAADSTSAAKVPFKDAKLIIEFNSTAEDIGIQMFLDADPWKTIDILNPNGKLIFEVDGRSNVRRLGMTELFFESHEPSINDLSIPEFLALFPEGEYTFVGRNTEGDTVLSKVPFSHKFPDGPFIIGPKKKGRVDPQNTVISWDPVVTPAGIQIVQYEVIVEGGNPQRNFDVFVPGNVTSLQVSPEFLEPHTKYIFEVLAIEANGNQTISEGEFKTE
jgi:hypothetical protein